MFLLNQENKMEIPEDTTPFCNDLFSRTQFCHQLVQSNLEKANEIHAKIEDMPDLFGVGEFVWLFNPGRYSGEHPTFKTLWESPFEVLAKKKALCFSKYKKWENQPLLKQSMQPDSNLVSNNFLLG